MDMDTEFSRAVKELNCLYKELDDLYHALARKLGLSDSALDILYTLCQLGDGCLQKDVCAFSYTSKQTINSSIRKLEREGIVALKPGKGRDMHIFLTQAGAQLTEQKIRPILQMEQAVFREMPAEERALLLRLTRAYVAGLRRKTDLIP